ERTWGWTNAEGTPCGALAPCIRAFVHSCILALPCALPQHHRPLSDDLFDFRDERRRRTHADLRRDVRLDAQAPGRHLDLKRYAAIAPMPGEDLAERLEGAAIGGHPHANRHLARQSLAHAIDRQNLGRQNPNPLVVSLQL